MPRLLINIPQGRALDSNHWLKVIHSISDEEAAAYVRSLNVHRRQLTAEEKVDAVAKLLKLDPTKSDRQIAEEAKSNRNTVGRVRVKLQESGDVSLSDTRKDTKGRKQPAKKVKAAKPKADRKQVEEMIERQAGALAAIAAREEQRQKLPAEAARIESEQLDNVTKNADFGADVVVESPSIMMTDAGPTPVPAASDDVDSPLDVLCAEWARSNLKSRFDALEPADQVAFLAYLKNAISYN